MEGNIYNKISQDINIKLPDINFDSDSDEIDSDTPIKPYIRPANEVLFRWDDSDSEAILDILSKMPSDSTANRKEESISKTESLVEDHLPSNMTDKIPYTNISLPNGIRTHVTSESDDKSDCIKLSNFGIHENVDLDKVLEEMDLNSYDTSFFEEALHAPEELNRNNSCNTESVSSLLTRLDEMSKKYEECQQNSNNCNVNNAKNTGVSLSNLFHQLKHESTKDTVTIDLRVENKLWSTEVDPQKTKEFIRILDDIIREEESSDEEEDPDPQDTNSKKELWIDSYRKSKSAQKLQINKVNEESSHEIQETKTQPSERYVKAEETSETVAKKEDPACNPGGKTEIDTSIPKSVQMKIDKIKEREKTLSERRAIIARLGRLLPVGEDFPLLVHEEVSFDPLNMSLLPSITPEEEGIQSFRAIVLLSSPNVPMTISKVPSPIGDCYPKENFAAILSVLIQFTKSEDVPFTVVGLQQIHYQDQLQLSLVCRTKFSLTKLKSELKKITLRDLSEGFNTDNHLISNLPLSNILRILPYNTLIDGNIWNWNNGSVVWHKSEHSSSMYGDQDCCKPQNINNSCVVLEESFYLSKDLFELILKLQEKCSISGMRLVYLGGERRQLLLSVRGFDAVNVVKGIQNKSPLYRNNVICTRFQENCLKETVKYFGPRLNGPKIASMLLDNLDWEAANTLSDGLSIYHSMYFNKPSDIILIVSPMCLDVGWVINTLQTFGGYLLMNLTRLNLSTSSGRQLGINENLVDNFDSRKGVCHLLILRNENPLHTIKIALQECANVIFDHDPNLPNVDQIFFSASYHDSLLSLLDLQKISQTPSIRELVLNIPDSPFEDCEQCSFVLLISDELTRHLAQLLDQMSNLDLLAVKCMTSWPSDDHLSLIQTQFKMRLPVRYVDINFEETEGKMRIAVIAVRSMFLMKELEKIQVAIRVEKNLIFAYTMNVAATFGMVGSFFLSSELISDDRRRSSLTFLPSEIKDKIKTMPILAQFPLVYSSILTALSVKIKNSSSVLPKFRQLWFLLTREGFEVVDVILVESGSILFTVKRPNALFYLTQWARSHFSDDGSMKIAFNEQEVAEMTNANTERPQLTSLTFLKCDGDLAFVMLDELLLDSSPEALASCKLFWSFLEENNFNCISLSLRCVNGSDIFKLRDVTLRSLSGSQMKKESRYLCLLLTGSIISTVIEDLLNCKMNSLNEESRLRDGLYLCCDSCQIVDCCNTLLRGAILPLPRIDVCHQ